MCFFFFCCSERKKISSTSYHLAWTEIRVNGLHCLGVFGVELPYQKKFWVLSAGWWLRVERVHLTSEVSHPDDVWIKWWEMIKEETIMSKWDVIFVNRWISPSGHDLMFAFTQRLKSISYVFFIYLLTVLLDGSITRPSFSYPEKLLHPPD